MSSPFLLLRVHLLSLYVLGQMFCFVPNPASLIFSIISFFSDIPKPKWSCPWIWNDKPRWSFQRLAFKIENTWPKPQYKLSIMLVRLTIPLLVSVLVYISAGSVPYVEPGQGCVYGISVYRVGQTFYRQCDTCSCLQNGKNKSSLNHQMSSRFSAPVQGKCV